ncbi:hypothetical protein J6590_099823 [Homalodisca vitripennis]|nr:hypothetical protein J6590_099823 [Homalodisca vitripennis]
MANNTENVPRIPRFRTPPNEISGYATAGGVDVCESSLVVRTESSTSARARLAGHVRLVMYLGSPKKIQIKLNIAGLLAQPVTASKSDFIPLAPQRLTDLSTRTPPTLWIAESCLIQLLALEADTRVSSKAFMCYAVYDGTIPPVDADTSFQNLRNLYLQAIKISTQFLAHPEMASQRFVFHRNLSYGRKLNVHMMDRNEGNNEPHATCVNNSFCQYPSDPENPTNQQKIYYDRPTNYGLSKQGQKGEKGEKGLKGKGFSASGGDYKNSYLIYRIRKEDWDRKLFHTTTYQCHNRRCLTVQKHGNIVEIGFCSGQHRDDQEFPKDLTG